MSHPTPQTYFFAGTDTEVGKTYTAALIARSLYRVGKRVGVYKPVASDCKNVDGTLLSDDAVALWEAAGRPLSLDEVCPQRFVEPLAPPEAAAAEGKTVDADSLRTGAQVWESGFDVLIVEGAGGLLSPLAHGTLNIDLVKQLEGSVLVIVAANRLGVVHQVLATTTAAIHHGVTPLGVILSHPQPDADPSVAGNVAQIERYCDVPILGVVGYGDTVANAELARHFTA